ncbi:MAG: hypothetical protein QG673_2171 [Pseudomonadota bacterium]|jgi:hypothetical protein|nr:hypothetical protein [Pseudomonadota bacterium]
MTNGVENMSLGCSMCSKIITGEAANCTKCGTELCRPCAELTKYRCHCGGYFKKTHIAGLMGKMFGTTGTIIIIIIIAAIYLNRADSNKNTITDSDNVATSQASTKSLIEDNKTTTQTTNLDQDNPENETQSTNTAEVNSASTVDLDQEKNTSTDIPSTENHDEVKNTENASSAN